MATSRKMISMWTTALILGAAVCACAEDGADPATPQPMAELAARLVELEDKVLAFDDQIEQIRQGRLKTLMAESLKARHEANAAKRTLSALERSIKSRVEGGYNKELARLKKERDRAIKRARDIYRGAIDTGPTCPLIDKRAVYESAVKSAKDDYKAKRDELKEKAKSERDRLKEANAQKIDTAQDAIRSGEATLKRTSAERAGLLKKIADVKAEARPFERELLEVRNDVAQRPDEALAAGLRPLNSRYVLDETTGALSLSGGVWGKPRENEDWQKSNENQARALLALAKENAEAGSSDLARKCLDTLLKDLPGTSVVDAAKTLLAEL